MPKTCPSCGTHSSGKFCSQCGTPLETQVCGSCGNQIPEGGRFCNMCGTAVAAARSKSAKAKAAAAPAEGGAGAGAGAGDVSRNLPWFVAGAAVLGLIAVVLIPQLTSDAEEPLAISSPPAAGPAAGGNPSAVDLSSMTPREAADRLFNRVMQAVSAGDTAQARSFAPMAISAYGMVEDLDLDGLYHVALIQLVNGQPAEALATSNTILESAPQHLFGLFTAAEAQQALGDEEAARELYRRFLEGYDTEIGTNRPEYSDHAAVLPGMRQQALQVVDGA